MDAAGDDREGSLTEGRTKVRKIVKNDIRNSVLLSMALFAGTSNMDAAYRARINTETHLRDSISAGWEITLSSFRTRTGRVKSCLSPASLR